MNRRHFIGLLGGAAIFSLAARAQHAMPVIGALGGGSRDLSVRHIRAFQQGLSDAGYVDGQNVTIDYRWAEGRNDRLPVLAADLVRRQVDVIASMGGTPPTVAAKDATETIPIVFVTAADPVAAGLVKSLNRPGGNLTGVTSLNVELGPKKLELLHALTPTATIIALLVDPTNPNAEVLSKELQVAADALGLRLDIFHASADAQIDAAFAMLAQRRVGALVIGTGAFFNLRSERLAALSVRHSVPAIFQSREFVAAGGLASYGGSISDSYNLAGAYAGRILKGEKPADLPVQQSTKAELVINLKTAKALGINVPLPLLGRADEVIE